ncbi:MAG: lipase family protein [Actinomycetota bacterium]|nr:lipase family protein [Actinomycetota bacterium]
MAAAIRVLIGVVAVGVLAAPQAAWGTHIEKLIGPSEPARDFPTDFMSLLPNDLQEEIADRPKWTDRRVGGWGGTGEPSCPPGRIRNRPVIFVHGNTEDASFWRAAPSGDGTIVNVRQSFIDGGYCAGELWAISYTGGRGYFTYNDINAEELYLFIQAVLDYTRWREVDIVAHSLGVTVLRKAALLFPELYDQMASFVAIAGANHGTTSCRGAGEAHVSHVCEETHPDSPLLANEWLHDLNAFGETPDGPRYLTIYDGSGLADHFYLGPDASSPRLEGACNFEMPFTAHNTLARGAAAVKVYLDFIGGDSPDCA